MMNELHMKKMLTFQDSLIQIFYKEKFKNRSKKCVDFSKKIIDVRKTAWYGFLKKEIILKANLFKGRVAKPEGTKVRKLDHVSRLPLFPYHHNIWKRCLNRRDSDTFYTIQMCDFREIQQGHWQDFGKCPFCMQKQVTKLAGTGSLYTDKSRIVKHKTERGFL